MDRRFKRTGNPANLVGGRTGGKKPRFGQAINSKRKPCKLCALPHDERLRVDWLLISGYGNITGYREHLKHLADDITAAEKYRNGSYGDALLGKVEWVMEQMREIAEGAREADKPKLALLALRNLGDLAGTQAKILGLGVPRSQSNKNSLHLHLGKDVKPQDLSRAIDAFQRTQLPAPDASGPVVEVESVSEVERQQ